MHWRRNWQPTPVFLPGESQGRRDLVGYSPRVVNSHTHTHNMFTNKLGFFFNKLDVQQARKMHLSVLIVHPKRRCWERAALNMSANLENSAVAIGLEKVSFHSNPKERQYQRMLKLPHNCPHLTQE